MFFNLKTAVGGEFFLEAIRLWKERGWGWSLWEIDSAFGVLDFGRKDVEYEEFRGRRLDRALLSLLQKY